MVKDEESEELISQSRKQEQENKEGFRVVFLTSKRRKRKFKCRLPELISLSNYQKDNLLHIIKSI